MTWSVEGTYIEACNCEAACPCIFLSPPTEDDCRVLVGWHIDKGRHGDAVLDGLNAALIAFAPGNMKDGQWKVALYLDSRGDDKQKAALQGIFSGADGGHLANLGPLIGEVLGARPARISFSESGNRQFRFEVDGAASTEMEAIQGQGGGTTEIKGHPLAISPGYPVTVSRASHLRIDDFGIKCEVGGRNGFFAPFAYQS
ncbi:DUF1326 domain-containing protein [Rhodoblastus acidophilus]|uniref:DUF1326 domain-containing protein n=1 Tax=Candidatus Rhodoblastus alkanivorans TaxID=2954117 RepID=A0ABS9Z7R6_9HYPH|nr:DUF1326 domain-containing protein [Candidatus Rhodoblastus alkanivorans]MCI4679880.1 DUF1326 domain-containing protein [Candidatus Rhodoblastus alkanivorans]MCI4682717.1 DUF1326 domain-containing protein [Candidatus Rhodoblastus alkanivorans]MDI4640024.1 DUF1326 domain-containing protein [Rhodoblastus acidophilus]